MKKESKLALIIGIGIMAGTVIGAITDNVGLWISLGTAIGAGIGVAIMGYDKKDDDKTKDDTKP